MMTLLLRRSPSLKEMRDQFLVHCIPAVLESKRTCEKSMAISFQDTLASTCPHFVEVLRVRRCRLGIEPGAVYYLRSSNDTVVRVGASTSRSTHNLRYNADVPFIKKYSVLFELGEQFKWEKAGDFENWLGSIVNARPKFIQPFYRSANALPVLPTSPPGIDHHCCWFVDVVQIRQWIFGDVSSDITIEVTGGTFALHKPSPWKSSWFDQDVWPHVLQAML